MPNSSNDRTGYSDRDLLIALGGELEALTEAVKELKLTMGQNTSELQGENGLRVRVSVMENKLDTTSRIVWGAMAAIGVETLTLIGAGIAWLISKK